MRPSEEPNRQNRKTFLGVLAGVVVVVLIAGIFFVRWYTFPDVRPAGGTENRPVIDFQRRAITLSLPIVGVPFRLTYRSDALAPKWRWSVYHAYDPGSGTFSPGNGWPRVLTPLFQQSAEPPAWLGVGEMAIAAQDGSEIYIFNQRGDHLRTVSALTGALVYRFDYASVGILTAITDAYGNRTKIERDAAGFMTAVVAPYGQRTTFSNNDKGYPKQITNPAGETISLDYSPNGQLAVFTDGNKNTYRFTTDGNGFLSKFVGPAGDFVDLTQTSAVDNARLTWTTAMERRSGWQVERTSDGTVTAINTNAAGLQTHVRRNGNTTKVTYADGRTVSQVQQADPRWGLQSPLVKTLSFSTPGGRTTAFSAGRTVKLADTSDPLNVTNLAETASVNGHSYKQIFDTQDRQMTLSTPSGRRIVTTLDEHGRAVNVQVPGLFPIYVTYDPHGRLATVKQGEGADARLVSLEYNKEGWLASVTDPLKRTVRIEHDAAGRISKRILADGSELALQYDANGNLTSVTPPARPSHLLRYAPNGKLSAYIPPQVDDSTGKQGLWNAITSYLRKLFGGSGRLPAPELGPGDKSYTYDKDGQLTAMLQPGGSNIQFTYDNAGRLSAIKGANAESSIAYDPKSGTPTNVTSADGVVLAAAYDGSLLTRLDWSGPVKGSIAFTYDNDLHPSSTDVNDASPIKLEYDADGLLTRAGNLNITRDGSNGLVTKTTLGQVATAEEYNGFAEPVVRRATYGSKEIFADGYERDSLGRVIQKTETIDGQTTVYRYMYDLAGRLTDVSVNGTRAAHYDYDPNGNRIGYAGPNGTVKASYDEQDRLQQYGNATYAHTPNGEWLSKTADGRTTMYSYDGFGNLKGVSSPDGTKIEYLVDGLNRRVGKKVNGKTVQGFVYQDQLKVVAELDGANQLVSRFVYARDSNVPDYMVKAGKTYRIITDALGSTRLVVDADTGAIAQRMDYDEFGNVLRDTNPGFQPLGFAGGLYDRDTKFAKFGTRDYDCLTGRWTSQDAILSASNGVNLYAYVNNDPVSWNDATGLGPSSPSETYWNTWKSYMAGVGSVVGSATAGAGTVYSVYKVYQASQAFAELPGLGIEGGFGMQFMLNLGGLGAAAAEAGLAATATTATVALGAGLGIGFGIDAAYESHFGQSIGADWADIKLPSGESLADWWHCHGWGSSDASGCGSGTGDIHMETFDGLRYDLQAAGEFLASQDPTGKIKIQVRLEPNDAHSVSYCTAVGASVDGAKVAIHVKPQPQVYIDGKAVTIEPGRGMGLGNGGEIRFTDSSEWTITWPDNTGVRVKPRGSYLDVVFRPGSFAGKLVGLLGNGDGNPTGDLVTRDGAVLEKALTSKDLYGRFAESWRITQNESLFHYAKGESTATFTDRTVPRENVTVDTLDPAARAEAERQCRAAGITAPAALSDCIIDFAVTGDRRFLASAALAQAIGGAPRTSSGTGLATGGGSNPGSVMVSGTGDEPYEVLDASGQTHVAGGRTNSATDLPPGKYTVSLNGSRQVVEVTAGQQAVVRTGSLMVTGSGNERYRVDDSSGKTWFDRPTNSVSELLPGSYSVSVNGVQQRVEITAGQQAVIRTGTLMVTGGGKERYRVDDSSGKAWFDRPTNSVSELLPGSYSVSVNGVQQRVEITAGQQAVVRTGSLMVTGSGKERYRVDDSTGKAWFDRPTNSDTDLLPGTYIVTVGTKKATVTIRAGQRTTVNP